MLIDILEVQAATRREHDAAEVVVDIDSRNSNLGIPSWLKDINGCQVTPSVEGQLIEHGHVGDNNSRRFRKL